MLLDSLQRPDGTLASPIQAPFGAIARAGAVLLGAAMFAAVAAVSVAAVARAHNVRSRVWALVGGLAAGTYVVAGIVGEAWLVRMGMLGFKAMMTYGVIGAGVAVGLWKLVNGEVDVSQKLGADSDQDEAEG